MLLEDTILERGLREVVAARMQLDALEAALVIEARLQWASWREIGRPLGITPQAAWKRYRSLDPRPPRPPRPPDRPPFDSPTPPADRLRLVSDTLNRG